MALDEHYNEPGAVPEPLEDHEPSDKPASIGIFVAIIALAALGLAALIFFALMG